MFSAFSQDTFDFNIFYNQYVFSADTNNVSSQSKKENYTKLWNDIMNSDNLYHSEMCYCESVYDELFSFSTMPEKKKLNLSQNKLV
jgi:hypothetical protein